MAGIYVSPVTEENICAILSETSHIYDREFLEWYAAQPGRYLLLRDEGSVDDCAILARSVLLESYVIPDSMGPFVTVRKKV